MTTAILMPALSPTMETGKLAKWHVKEGDEVRSGDIIAEIETDKATMEVEAVDEGRIGKLLVAEGAEHVPVNQPIAILLVDGEERSQAAASSSPQRGEVGAQSAPGEGGHPPTGTSAPSPQPSPQRGEGVPPPVAVQTEQVMNEIAEQIRANGTNGDGMRVFVSPLARRLARERGIELKAIAGSGPHGRIVKADIERAVAARGPAPEEIAVDQAETAPGEQTPRTGSREVATRQTEGLSDAQVLALYEPGSYELVPHDTMRRFIAERLTLSKRSIPHFYLAIDCDIDALLAARARMNGLAPQEGPRAFKLSVNDFIIKALAMALQSVPGANATWTEGGVLRHRASDIAVAVALEGGGLFTPVIRNAEIKSLSEISNEMKDLAGRARSKRLAPHEYQGGVTAISNLGMYGIDRFDAVINPPQSSILAVGRAEKRPVVKDDALKIATMMSVTLSVDHRVIDGALGAELLAAFKAFIQDPVTMLV
ncbi:MAG TPA: pyruvate dehydrogenase complex dihydrolipoamide acetyltransferase [Methyloceanibacter sp.]|nr:pyruvate dehydrogenase complex dihydrolipoamide acetyltransferase [Methyloceanibacter sp.]